MSRSMKTICIAFMSAIMAVMCVFAGIFFAYAEDELFPNGGFEGAGGNWTNNGATPVLVTDEVHSGEKSLKVSEFWARLNLRGDESSPGAFFKTLQDGAQEGKIYQISMWTKSPAASRETSVTLGAGIQLTGQAGSGWAYPRVNLFGGMYCYANSSEWIQRKGIFGLVTETDGTISIFTDGLYESTTITAIANADFDVGSNSGGSYFDDISVTKGVYAPVIRLTVKSDGQAVGGQATKFTFKDKNGTVLTDQPVVKETAEGVYTVTGLTFNTLKDFYRYEISGSSGVKEGIITARQNDYEIWFTSYTAQITVKDENATPITDARITATVAGEEVAVSGGENGIYRIENLYADVDIMVEKENLLTRTLTLTPLKTEADVIMKKENPATVIQGNLVANGNFEETLAAGTQEPGKWNAEIGIISQTTNNQQDGKYGLWVSDSAAYRIDLGSIATDGTKYVCNFAAATDDEAAVDLSLRATVSAGGKYEYPRVNLVKGQELTSEFTKVQATFSITFNELEKKAVFTANGVDTVVENVTSFAAIDFVFGGSKGVYLDNVACLNGYDIEFVVREGGAELTEGLTFDIIGYDGKNWDVDPVYKDGKWVIENACGVVQVTVSTGEKTFPVQVFDARNVSATIETGFNLTVTLKDTKGNLVKGAQIVAKKGAAELFTMTDNGDGTYAYANASGTFNLYITLEGYVFPVERNVSSAAPQLTIVATSAPIDGNIGGGDENPEKKGCGSMIFGGTFLTGAALMTVGCFAIMKKKK